MAKKYCPNCYYPLAYKAKFCAHCAQKNQESKVSISELLQQLWLKVFHMESRYYRAMWRLLLPGQVSIDYFKGQRKRYPLPIQFFFIIMFLFLLIVNYTGATKQFFEGMQVGFSTDNDSTSSQKTPLPNQIFPTMQKAYLFWKFKKEYAQLPASYQDTTFRGRIDSLLFRTLDIDSATYTIFFEQQDSTRPANTPDSISIAMGKKYRIAMADIYILEPEEVADLYGADIWYDRLAIRQGLRVIRDPEAVAKNTVNSLAWTILVLMVFGAGLLWLLHFQKRRYYVEHLFFLLHVHSGDFLLLSAFILLSRLFPDISGYAPFVVLWIIIASFIAMYRYYRQHFVISLLKWLLFSFVYFVLGFLIFLGSMLVILLVL